MKYVGENALKKWTSLVKFDIKKKLDKNQGTTNSGKILGVDASGEVAPTDTEVATLVDVPNGLLKGDGTTISAAVAGTDYMAPVTGGTAGQVLTKTTDGQEWKDREKATFIVTLVSSTEVDKTVAEIKAANDAGRVCFLRSYRELYPLFAVDDTEAIFAQSIGADDKTIIQYNITVNADGQVSIVFTHSQKLVEAAGLLKGDGNGTISSAVAGTDYVAPNGDASNVTAEFTAASTRANVATGEKLSVLFSKIAKWFADLGSLAFKSTVAKSDLASDVQTSLGKADSALQSYTETDPTVPAWAKATSKPSYTKSEVGLGNVDNVKQYSASNPPPYPVTSINGKTGAVTVETSSGTTYNATLSSSGWTTSGSYKKQTITVTGLKANYPVAPVVDAQLTGTDADGDTAVLTGFSAINLIQTAENQLIAYCIGDAPTVNIPLIINTWG